MGDIGSAMKDYLIKIWNNIKHAFIGENEIRTMNTDRENYGKEIYDSLEEYICDDRYHQAVLLDGPWGSGKTWFVKNVFIPQYQEKHGSGDWHFLYLSLYGLQSIDELKTKQNQIFAQQILQNLLEKGNISSAKAEKITGFAWTALGALKSVVSIAGSALPVKELANLNSDELLKAVPKPRHVVLVLDDLERTEIDIETVLGYINELTEHEAMKVIAIANEKEICKVRGFDDKEKSDCDDGEQSTKSLSQKRYELIKEKTIGLNITYQVVMRDVYTLLAERYVKVDNLRECLDSECDYIINAFAEHDSQNLRILIFAFIACDKFYALLNDVYNLWKRDKEKTDEKQQETFNELVSDVIKYTILSSIAWKQWKRFQAPTTELSKNSQYWQFYRYRYPFVESFIEHRRIDTEKAKLYIQGVLDDLLDRSKGRNKAYDELMKWQILNDDDIYVCLESLKAEIPQKKLEPDYIRNLILVLIYISNAGIKVNMDVYIEKVMANLKQENLLIFTKENLFVSHYINDQSILKKYNDALRPVYDWMDEKAEKDREREYYFLIHNEWTSDFKVNCQNKMTCFMSDKKFLSYVNPKKVLEKLETASAAEICYFTSGIQLVYKPININEFYKSDISNIDTIVHGIEKMEPFKGKVKSWNVEQLKKILIQVKSYLN